MNPNMAKYNKAIQIWLNVVKYGLNIPGDVIEYL